MSTRFNLALASYGMSGRIFHAPFIEQHPGLVLHSILERSQSLARERYPNAKIVRDFAALLEDPAIDVVVVNTPNTLHYPMARAALEAGKHVIVEKPFTVSVDEGKALIELAEQRQLMLSVYHNRRLQSGHLTVRQLLERGELGQLNTFATHIDRYRPEPGPKKWKEDPNPGAGLLYDLGSHLLDEAAMLFGLPLAVTADLRCEREHGQVCDYFQLRLDYPRHKCLLSASMLAREPGPAYLLHGDKASYLKAEGDIQESLLAAGAIPDTDHWCREQPHQWGLLHSEQGRSAYPTVDGRYQDFYDNIYRHLSAGQPLKVLADQALVTIGLIEIAEHSAREKRTIVLGGS
ncbi:Gfo/Idh/MocA family oxidoreductase [Gilvimarinus algae]|uniref:Gfo/Idh/MocA family oxidoreductase n=1 Tax=Gilvimarinus algae TaxID=3058037 RepID=A0ABT8TDB4_9GAMM|nr:Gfo/Idh/MocA family oxidoreductase [Gilvimarinus sp. SDUM040014]MDO3380651.1 Gfo/Idh/MocA family oxidoreductase [Gilvimarinus sp. SDUM040014]